MQRFESKLQVAMRFFFKASICDTFMSKSMFHRTFFVNRHFLKRQMQYPTTMWNLGKLLQIFYSNNEAQVFYEHLKNECLTCEMH